MKRRGRLVSCPSCKKERDVDAQDGLRRAEAAWSSRAAMREGGMRDLALASRPNWFWACDACLRSGRALSANVDRQHLGLGTPFAAYVDRPFRCEDCGVDSLFSAQEQAYWFETLGFLIWVYPKQCPSCRANRRIQKRTRAELAAMLDGVDAADPAQLEAIARAYEKLGSSKKAAEFHGRAKNRRSREG
jgi:rubrerythrin